MRHSMVWISPEEQLALEMVLTAMLEQFDFNPSNKKIDLHFYILQADGKGYVQAQCRGITEELAPFIYPNGIKLIILVDYLFYRLSQLVNIGIKFSPEIELFRFEIECEGHTMSSSQGKQN